MALLTAATLLSGCSNEGYQIEVSEDTESSDRTESLDSTESFDCAESFDDAELFDSTESSNRTEDSEGTDMFDDEDSSSSSSVLEGAWYAFDIVKRNEDTPWKVTFDLSTVLDEDQGLPPKKYTYDEGSQMLEIDYREFIEYINDFMQMAEEDDKTSLEEARQQPDYRGILGIWQPGFSQYHFGAAQRRKIL